MARSRSSMTAEIFRQHGVFFGNTYRPKHRRIGYNESLVLKDYGREHRPEIYRSISKNKNPVLEIPREVIEEMLRDGGYTGGPWAVKVDAFCVIDGIQIGIWRNPDDIMASCKRVFSSQCDRYWGKIIAAHHDRMRDMQIPMINTDELIGGNYLSIERAFDKCGLEFDAKIAELCIQK